MALSVFVLVAAAQADVGAADPRCTMVRTDSLTVIGDQSASTLRDIATQLEQFRVVVAGLIHNADRPPALPTTVFVFGARKAMQPFVPLVNGRPASIAGFFQRDQDVNSIVLSLEGFEESAAVTYHEYTHLLVGNAVRSVPVWMDEGLAEYYSSYRLADGGRVAEVGRPLEGRLAILRERYLPLSDIIAVDQSSALYNESNKRSIFYAEAWALTHYVLTQMPNGGAAINTYAAEIAEGRTPHEAFFSAFGATPAEFDKQLRAYTQRPVFGGTRFTFKDKIAVTPPSPARTLSPAEAGAWLGDLQRRVGREAEAAPRIDAAVTADPEAGITHLSAGLLRFSQQRTSEGLQELERAAALAPDDFLTQYLNGVWLLRADLEESARHSDAAIVALTRATALKPESSDAYAWLAYAEMQRDETLGDARASIERAIELSPGRADYRLRWADIRILQGGFDEARRLLTAIAAIRTDQRSADGARTRLDTLAEYEQHSAPRNRGASSPLRAGARPIVRQLKPGEQRAFGLLTRIDCRAGAVRFEVSAAGRTVVAETQRIEDVELISYLDEKAFTLACGARPQPQVVYVTWVPDASPSGARDGIAVAIEFLPPNYVP